jgi:hypothetical protein
VRNNGDKHSEREAMVFSEFLKAAPSIAAADVCSWSRSDDIAYDVTSQSSDSRCVKWQITEWLDPAQTQTSKERIRLKEAIEDTLDGLEHECLAVSCYLFLRDPPVRFKNKSAASFRAAMLALIRDIEAFQNAPMPRQRYTWPRAGECVALESDLAAWPVLERYLRQVHFEIAFFSTGKGRVAVVNQGGSFNEEDAVAELTRRIRRKMRDYQWPPAEDIRLLTFYDEGWRHNAPIYHPFVINAEKAAGRLREHHVVPFKYIYLMFGRSGEAYEIHPGFSRCA